MDTGDLLQSPSESTHLTAPEQTSSASGSLSRQETRVEPSVSTPRQPITFTWSHADASDAMDLTCQPAVGASSPARYAPTPRVYIRRSPCPTPVVLGGPVACIDPDQAASPGSSAATSLYSVHAHAQKIWPVLTCLSPRDRADPLHHPLPLPSNPL